MIRYVVTTYLGAGGANLSKLGSWGNEPYTSPAKAREAAHADANGEPYTITQERAKRPVGGSDGRL